MPGYVARGVLVSCVGTAANQNALQVDACGNQLQTPATHHVARTVPSEPGPAAKVSTKPYNKEVHRLVAKSCFAKRCCLHEQRT